MNKRKLIMGLVSVLFVVTPLLISSLVAWSQTNYGTIRGTVSDPTGALVPEVEIEAIHVSTNRKYTTPTTEAGVYALINLPLGEYQVTAKRAGFKEAVGSRVIVSVGSTTTLNITLEVGEVTEQVTVEETFAPLLTPDNAEVGTVVERAAIIDLPLSVTGNFRNPENFIRLTPGVTGDVFSKHYNGGACPFECQCRKFRPGQGPVFEPGCHRRTCSLHHWHCRTERAGSAWLCVFRGKLL